MKCYANFINSLDTYILRAKENLLMIENAFSEKFYIKFELEDQENIYYASFFLFLSVFYFFLFFLFLFLSGGNSFSCENLCKCNA